jgi:hypothetical protein
MKQFVEEYINTLPEILCDDIIEKYEEEISVDENALSHFIIPKTHKKWVRIEKLIYKELLINLIKYKTDFFKNNNIDNDFNCLLKKNLYIKEFIIQKCENSIKDLVIYNNRYNILTFILYLNDVSLGGEITFDEETTIKPEKGKLIIFKEDVNLKYFYNYNITDNLYIISGQFSYNTLLL